MLQYLYNKFIQTKDPSMSENNLIPETGQPQTNANENDTHTQPSTATAAQPQPIVRPPPTQSFNPPPGFMEAYDCAKLNNNWQKVSSSLTTNPDWLTKIPEGRRWTMLHQIVFSGDVMHLNEVLALQLNNPNFRLLLKALDDKTVREVATERAHVHPQMLRRIERLVAVDQLLNNAKDRKWELVKQCITLQPDIVNEKPPYRRFYLAHHLAYIGELHMFKELSKYCQFKLDLLAENKTISQTAREKNHIEFADYIDNLINQSNQTADDNNNNNNDDDDDDDFPTLHSGEHHYSPGFYEDPGISFIPANLDLNHLFPTTTSSYGSSGYHHYSNHYQSAPVYGNPHTNTDYFVTQSLYQAHNPVILTTIPVTNNEQNTNQQEGTAHNNNNHQEKSVKPKPVTPQLTEAEQAAYEQTIMANIQKMSHMNLLNSITCSITKSVLHDPVVAADGFTYERAAIENWFKESNRSPMTNQELENLDLKPNFAIKGILQLLQQDNNSSNSNSSKKPNADHDNNASAK